MGIDRLCENYGKPVLSVCLFILFINFIHTSFAQNTISGYIRDKETGEELIGATVYFDELKNGTISNYYGFYSITLPAGIYNMRISYIGYKQVNREVNLNGDMVLNIDLPLSAVTISEVVINASDDSDEKIKTAQMSAATMKIKEIKNIPVLFGETDIMKTIQLLPGIQSGGEGNTGFFVRGGGIDQNLILLDEAPVYNASHLLGFFSVFNSDAIKDMKIIKGGIPANYGGRLSSVLDVSMKNGNMKNYCVTGGVGLIDSRLTVEGPVKKDVGSFIISGRRTYGDLYLPLSSDPQVRESKMFFYDLNTKINYRINQNNRIYLSGYFGRDDFGYGTNFNFNWGNATGTLRWNHIFNKKLFSNTSLIYSNYDYYIAFGSGESKFAIQSSLNDFSLKDDFQFYRNPKSTVKFGFSSIYHSFAPGTVVSGETGPLPKTELDKKYAWENAVYFVHEIKRFEKFNFITGMRFTAFSQLGPSDIFIYGDNGNITDTLLFGKNDLIKTYFGVEPRFSVGYQINEVSSVKLSYIRTQQYLHLLSNTTSAKPTDLWVPSSYYIKPQIARQAAAGYYRNFFNNKMEVSAEIYYKKMRNQIEYKNGADLLLNNNIETQLTFGEGWSYGFEIMVKKKTGKLTGWLAYTWSKTEKQFDEINNGAIFPARQDRRHDFSIVCMYAVKKQLILSASWVYYMGSAATFPGGKYEIDGQPVNLYTERNGYRMPDYHRLDASVIWNFRKHGRFESDLVFSVYNLYARENAYSIEFRQNEDDPAKSEAVQLALFKIVPSITFNFKF
ncbi:MAG: collagen-binding protein [Bacteroidetes bacterium 4484_249]|nr:MAG: collagen-binding protein [Bacteroidetes bacterium 4484_249]